MIELPEVVRIVKQDEMPAGTKPFPLDDLLVDSCLSPTHIYSNRITNPSGVRQYTQLKRSSLKTSSYIIVVRNIDSSLSGAGSLRGAASTGHQRRIQLLC